MVNVDALVEAHYISKDPQFISDDYPSQEELEKECVDLIETFIVTAVKSAVKLRSNDGMDTKKFVSRNKELLSEFLIEELERYE